MRVAQVWEQQPRESAKAYDAFLLYRDLGAERSLAAVGQRLGKSKAICERWSARWSWVRRCAAYDTHLVRLADEARGRALEEEAVKWARRREAEREAQWHWAQRLRERAERMVAFPLAETTSEDGKTIIRPAKWTARDIATYVTTATMLAHSAMEAAPAEPEPATAPLTDKERAENIIALLQRAQARKAAEER